MTPGGEFCVSPNKILALTSVLKRDGIAWLGQKHHPPARHACHLSSRCPDTYRHPTRGRYRNTGDA